MVLAARGAHLTAGRAELDLAHGARASGERRQPALGPQRRLRAEPSAEARRADDVARLRASGRAEPILLLAKAQRSRAVSKSRRNCCNFLKASTSFFRCFRSLYLSFSLGLNTQ